MGSTVAVSSACALCAAAGGLAPDHDHWISSSQRFFLPIKVLSRVFRGKFVAGLKTAFNDGSLRFHHSLLHLADQRRFAAWLRTLFPQQPRQHCTGGVDQRIPDVDSSLNELAYALDELNLDGVVAFPNANGVYLGDPSVEPLFQELERRKCVVYVHPNASPIQPHIASACRTI